MSAFGGKADIYSSTQLPVGEPQVEAYAVDGKAKCAFHAPDYVGT